MIDRELAARAEAREMLPHLEEYLLDMDLPDDQTQCNHCQIYCYLSQFFSEASDAISCAKHVKIVHGDDEVKLRARYTDVDLQVFSKRCKGRSDKVNYASYQASREEPSGEARKSTRKVRTVVWRSIDSPLLTCLPATFHLRDR